MHRHWLDNNHCGPAPSPLFIVRYMPSTRQTILGHIGRMGAENDAIPQRPVAQSYRREKPERHCPYAHSAVGRTVARTLASKI